MHKIKYTLVIVLAVLLGSCEVQFEDFKTSAGDADLSSFVAIGDSYTAGYADGALYKEGQENSFANILASQINKVEAQDWKTPLLPEEKSIGVPPLGKYELSIVNGALSPLPGAGDAELLTDNTTWINADAPFNNVGVPAAKVIHLVSPLFGDYTLGEGNFNPFYTRFASQPGTSTVVGDAILNTPTFFSFWAGTYDVLTYAITGGIGNTSGINTNDITDQAVFAQALNGAILTLSMAQADQGIIANIPDITAFPFFNTILYNNLALSAEQATQMNAAYAQYNQVAPGLDVATMDFVEGANAFVVEDASIPVLGMRQIKEGELVLLSAQTSILGKEGFGSAKPLTDEMFLDLDELKAIKDAISGFNTLIKNVSQTNGLAFVDLYSWYNNLSNGITLEGNQYNARFVSGGFYSLDGIHPTQRGAAIIANEFIKAINSQYGANVPQVDINQYQTVEYP